MDNALQICAGTQRFDDKTQGIIYLFFIHRYARYLHVFDCIDTHGAVIHFDLTPSLTKDCIKFRAAHATMA